MYICIYIGADPCVLEWYDGITFGSSPVGSFCTKCGKIENMGCEITAAIINHGSHCRDNNNNNNNNTRYNKHKWRKPSSDVITLAYYVREVTNTIHIDFWHFSLIWKCRVNLNNTHAPIVQEDIRKLRLESNSLVKLIKMAVQQWLLWLFWNNRVIIKCEANRFKH